MTNKMYMKGSVRRFIMSECSGWKVWEVCWLVAASLVITGLSVYWGDTLMGIISATTGVICVVCTGKGKLSAYIFGLINSILYAIISFKATYYGETVLNAVYYVPMQFVGFWVWSQNINSETGEVTKRHMKIRQRIFTFVSIIILTYIYGIILEKLGDAMPYTDSFTTVYSVVAMVVSVRMFSEQWWIWVAVNILSVYMWWTNFSIGQDNMATLLMWIVYLGNSVIMLIKWEKDVAENKRKGIAA